MQVHLIFFRYFPQNEGLRVNNIYTLITAAGREEKVT
jgi:hypothetical protein